MPKVAQPGAAFFCSQRANNDGVMIDALQRRISTSDSFNLVLLVMLCAALYWPGIRSIPPIDRDEARFAQATKQMLESGDLIHIRFLDEPRHKKPPGIYWLQYVSVKARAWMSGDDENDDSGNSPKDRIWGYRLPSVLGALTTVLFVYITGVFLFANRSISLTAASLMAASMLLTAEAHQATSDAVLCAAMTACMGTLGVLYVRGKNHRNADANARKKRTWSDRLPAVAFWIALAVGVFVKGPIAALIIVVAVLTLVLVDRKVAILRTLSCSWIGMVVFLILTAGWAIPIHVATGGKFWRDAFFGDFLPKVAGGVESHSFPPGFYLVIFILTFWPGSLVAGTALARARKRPKESKGPQEITTNAEGASAPSNAVRFLFAWVLPMWVLLELTPTKLPHYVLPLYPAIALLTAAGLSMLASDRTSTEAKERRGVLVFVRVGFILWPVVTVGLGVVIVAGLRMLQEPFHWSLVVLVIGIAAAAVWCTLKAWHGRLGSAVAIGIGCSTAISAMLFGSVLPRAGALFTSRLIVEELRRGSVDGKSIPKELVSAGFHEPSLVFLTHSQIQLLSGRKAADYFTAHPSATILVSDSVLESFESTLAKAGFSAGIPIGEVRGLNYSKGSWATVLIYRNLLSEVRHARAGGQ